MEYCKQTRLLLLLLLLGTSGLDAAESVRIYRYIDNDGQVVFNSFIPADTLKNGYTVLDDKGRILEVIPRTLTQEELAALTVEQEKQRREEAARIAQVEADNILLRVYRNPADIERKRDLSLAEFDTRITDMTAKLAQLDARIAELEREADSAELADQQAERQELDSELLTLVAKRENAAYGFELDIKRLGELQGLTKNAAAK